MPVRQRSKEEQLVCRNNIIYKRKKQVMEVNILAFLSTL